MKNKFLALWFCLLIILIFFLQLSITGFTQAFVLNNQLFQGQLWRLVTPIFLHGGLQHLLYNLFALALFGSLLEQAIGSRRFLVVFFVTGIAANLISVNFYNSSLGASGAIMGIIGTLTLLRPKMMVWAFGVTMPMFLAAIVWIIGDVIGIFIPDGVGNIAHLSGIAFGLLLGLGYRNSIKRTRRQRSVHIPEDIINDWEMTYLVKR